MSIDWNERVAHLDVSDQEAFRDVVAALHGLVNAVVARDPHEALTEQLAVACQRLSDQAWEIAEEWLKYQLGVDEWLPDEGVAGAT